MTGERITIEPYDPRWAEAFERERIVIARALGAIAIRIEHNGSTAVPGLAAKPVIDIQISVTRLRPMMPYGALLGDLGYTHVPHDDDARCPFFFRDAHPPQQPYRHHIHVVEAGGEEERRTLAFRDRLRKDGVAAREYEALKRQLASQHDGSTPASVQAYVDGKTDFIARTIT
jgi:GrpB-like predicted nucleotidyltransferase (UPF0157 family)